MEYGNMSTPIKDPIEYQPWAMLATDMHTLDFTPQPMLVQPKLNGVRAMWYPPDKVFVSRQGKVFPKHIIPHLYEQFHDYRTHLDGELYTPNMSFQDICGVLGQHRLKAHKDHEQINFHLFDILSDQPALVRSNKLADDSPSEFKIVPTTLHFITPQFLTDALPAYLKSSYEGIMLRDPNRPYITGRTTALIKVKQLCYLKVQILGVLEGAGKFYSALGALRVFDPITNNIFKIGGGNITYADRTTLWRNRMLLYGRTITIGYTETSESGIPLKAQIVNRKELLDE